jgi:hypothetical protein
MPIANHFLENYSLAGKGQVPWHANKILVVNILHFWHLVGKYSINNAIGKNVKEIRKQIQGT